MINKQGQTRLAKYFKDRVRNERVSLEAEIVRKCLARSDNQCSFFECRDLKIVYRRYASLFFIFGVDHTENEMAILEFIHNMVETMDRYFESVCELDIMFNIDKVHIMLDEMVMNGYIIEANRAVIIDPLKVLEGK